MSVIWLVSYPKSGNTWTRAFLTAYLNGGKVNINRMVAPTAGARGPIDKLLSIDSYARPPAEVDALRPEALRRQCERGARNGRDPILIKVHDVWRTTSRNEPLFPREITRSVVYIVRNPLDVAVSFSHHLGEHPDQTAAHICNETFTLALHPPALKQQVPQLIRSWRSHVESWLDHSGHQVCLLKYEDMKRDPAAAFTVLLQRIGLTMEQPLFDRAIKAASLGALQAQELLSGFQEKSGSATAAFFRRGEVGQGARELSTAARSRIEQYCGDMMRRLGYPT